jgi:hypothetical protein
VAIDEPLPAEVKLTIKAFIRTDLVFEPEAVEFGAVAQDQSPEAKVKAIYTAGEDWRICEARSSNRFIGVQFTELRRDVDRVEYEVLARLTRGAPVGYIDDQITLVTNDPDQQRRLLRVRGRVVGPVNVSPADLVLGAVEAGTEIERRLVVHGREPFRIERVFCDDGWDRWFEPVDYQPTKEAKNVHVIPIVFKTRLNPGKVSVKISVQTDHGGKAVATCRVSGSIK